MRGCLEKRCNIGPDSVFAGGNGAGYRHVRVSGFGFYGFVGHLLNQGLRCWKPWRVALLQRSVRLQRVVALKSGVRERERESACQRRFSRLGHGTGRVLDWRSLWVELGGSVVRARASAEPPGLGATGR